MNGLNSILTSIKKMLGIDESYTQFDSDLIIHINSVFNILTQLGVGPAQGFYIEDDTATWNDYLTDLVLLNQVKSYMYLKVKLLFDPPLSSSAVQSMKELINEFEWRTNVTVDP